MTDSEHILYQFQVIRIAQTPWGEPNKPLEKHNSIEWFCISWDTFGHIIIPWKDDKPIDKDMFDDEYNVWSNTGLRGFSQLTYAREGLFRLRLASNQGEFDIKNYQTGNVIQKILHKFRITEVYYRKKTIILQY